MKNNKLLRIVCVVVFTILLCILGIVIAQRTHDVVFHVS